MVHSAVTIVFFSLCIFVGEAKADEYFGKFSGTPTFKVIDAEPRPLFELTEKFTFKDPNGFEWSVPAAEKVDGASIPQLLWTPIGGPMSGNYLSASVIHDYYCCVRTRTAHDTHRNFYYGMRAKGVSSFRATLMYWGVLVGGPSWELTEEKPTSNVCKDSPQSASSSASRSHPLHLTSSNDPISGNIRAQNIVLRKLAWIARNLRTTNGEYMDIGESGPILADLDNVERSAAATRQYIENEQYNTAPGKIGLVASYVPKDFNDISPWPKNVLPRYETAMAFYAVDSKYLIAEKGQSTKNVYFDVGEYKLRPVVEQALKDSISALKGNLPKAIVLSGHADPEGGREYNLALSERRANAVKDLLLANGFDENSVTTISYGKERSTSLSTEDTRAQDRRVEIFSKQ